MQVEIKVPQLPESVSEGTLGDWYKQVGDTVAVDENIVDLETDKVVLEIVASKAGVIESIAYASGDTVKDGDVLGVINTEAATAAADSAAPAEDNAAAGKASPAVRKLLNENDLSADDVAGTGKKGAILKADVERHLQQQAVPAAEPAAAAAPAPTPSAAPIPQAGRNDRRVPMSRLRSRIAERLKQAQNTAALLTTFNEVNLKPMMDARAAYRDAFEKTHGVKLGMMSFFTSAAVEALKRFPAVNASIDGDDIVYHDYFDIGIAVSSERGLVVPILRDADQLSYADIEIVVVNKVLAVDRCVNRREAL
jgi:2-oxoglutarate dehydrogenase E2 component (dihydrolipoamide succinyltransferase)